ncbi:uncharacterized oxidoreductase YjmC isoform X2 [Cherax quadricarinatus]|nr:uncharacterized oxidoreductase YjmC-like isoform X2 [Cherax quadricarinatus]
MVECMMTQGVSRDRATTLAQVLVAADVRGHYSHGLHRLGHYINDVKNNLCDAGTTPTIVKESVSTALVDGNNGLGPVVGKFAMDLAIRKAQTTGIGWVCAKGSNHYGIAGWYTMRAAKQGLVGVSFTNTHPVVVPTRGKQGALGTNPISVAAPAEGDDSFVLDMSTSVVAYGKVEVAHTKNEAIPEGWAVDKHGCMTTSSAECLDGGFIMPLGGPELHSGYKGFGLSMMVEIFCGIMSGSSYGPNLNSLLRKDQPADLSHCFVAVNPAFFAPGFEERLGDLMSHCRNMEPIDTNKPVLVAGDPERARTDQVKKDGGITYHINQVKEAWQLAEYLGVSPMQWI